MHPKKQVPDAARWRAADPGGSTKEASTKRSPWPGGRGDEWEGSYVDREGGCSRRFRGRLLMSCNRLHTPWTPEALVELIDFLVIKEHYTCEAMSFILENI